MLSEENMLDLPEVGSAKKVFEFFERISEIPHGSANTDKIADYLVSFAKERSLDVVRDGANNVIIRKGATAGYEDHPTIIIQGHTDMVEAKTPESKIDMKRYGLTLYRDGDYLRAQGTTLGGDDGVAVAYALAILDSSDIPHPPIEAVFTSDEEIGLLGAVALDGSLLNGRIMINVDSDTEGIFTVGCAGGMRIDVNLPTRVTKTKKTVTRIRVDGLKGGHSGTEIDKGRENAIKILGEVLSGLGARIGELRGGNADNAIPRWAECVIEDADGARLEKAVNTAYSKYKAAEPDMTITITHQSEAKLLSAEDSELLVGLICEEPSGVIQMSEDIAGLVETSLNLGIAECTDDLAALCFSVRSAKGSEKQKLAARVTKIAESKGATCITHGEYPAWEYRKCSPLRDVMCRVYKSMYGKDARVVTIHAGLECGIFADKLEGLDCVSIGPDNLDIHTTEERLSISSTVRVYEFLKEIIKNI